jgi:hypothetical protein
MAWFKRFYDPIVLPDGRELLTLRDAAEYITALPKAEHDAADWRVAMETLLLVAERDGPEMLARIAVMKALNRQSKPIRLFGGHGALLGACLKKREQSSN